MICPNCKTKDKFKVDRSSVYCMAKPHGNLCGYTLSKKEKEIYRKEQSSSKDNPGIKKLKKVEGCTITQIADLNKMHRNTVRKHLDEFDIIPGTNPTRYRLNTKLLKKNWKTLREKELEKYVQVINFHGYEFILDDKGKPII